MEYTLSQGATEKTILEQCYRNRTPIPKSIQDAPTLGLGLGLFYDAFMHLTTCRALGANGTESPISWIVMMQYCEIQGITGDQREDLIYHVAKMDTVYMQHRLKEAKQRSQEKKSAKSV